MDEQYPLGGQDFTSLLTKVKAANPDAFIVIDIMPSAVYMTRQMGEVGFRPKLYAVNIGPMFAQEFTATLGKSAENVVENGFWHPDLPYKGAKEFYADFVAKIQQAAVDRRGLRVHLDQHPAAGDRARRNARPRADHGDAAYTKVRHHPRALRIRRARRQQGPAQLPGPGPERPAHDRVAERGRQEQPEAAVLIGVAGPPEAHLALPAGAARVAEAARRTKARNVSATTFVQLLLFGVVWGGLYALIALGLNLIFGVMKILNIAHGELLMLGAYMAFWLFTLWHISPLVSIPVAAIAMCVFGLIIQKLLIDPRHRAQPDAGRTSKTPR